MDQEGRSVRGQRLHVLQGIRLRTKSQVDVLRAIDNYAGWQAKVKLRVATIAEYLHVSEKTVRRAIRALEAAHLLIVYRRNRRKFYGGQGPSEYQIVWSNLRDLYDSQTGQKQFQFPADGAQPSVGHDDRAPGRDDQAPGHGDQAPGLCDQAPGHGVHPQYITAPRSANRSALPLPSSERASGQPSGGSCRPDAAGAGGREGSDCVAASESAAAGGGWPGVVRALEAYGVRDARRACSLARANGCGPTYVGQLLDHARHHTLPQSAGRGSLPVRCWGAGAVWYRVIHARPNEPIAEGWPPPAEAYVRAKRDRDRAAELQLQRAAARREQERAAKSREEREAHLERLEAEYGPRLDAMTRDEKLALVAGTGLKLDAVEAFGGRLKLLELLAAQEGAASPWTAGGNGAPPAVPEGDP